MADGVVVATEKQQKMPEIKENESDWKQVHEEITIQGENIELWMKDLIVAAWCAKIWQANNARVSFARNLIRQGMSSLFDTDSWSNSVKRKPLEKCHLKVVSKEGQARQDGTWIPL